MRRLFIHVGPHKTGTTSIQAFMARCRPAIRQQGVAVYSEDPRPNVVQANAWQLAHCFIRAELPTPMRILAPGLLPGSAEAALHVRRFEEWSVSRNVSTCLVSAESFSFLRTDREAAHLQQVLGTIFERITPVLTIRDPVEWRRSWHQQLRTMGLAAREAAQPDHLSLVGSWYFDQDALRRFWARLGDVAELDYAAAIRDHGSIIPAFCKAIGVDVSLDEDIRLNVSKRPPANPDGGA